ncbi:thymidylate kinase-domain-containing protein [Dipodascopsis tothii]|uniref:thymidylate kinase-domain-containing protein n=1 Tax=Dipodascopsis tothii TaxID=44089 RepID=UPI0034CE3A6C
MASTLPRGRLILLEGLDRSGKTTQVARLVSHLNERGSAVAQKFPDRTTELGKTIDAYLRAQQELSDEAIHLLFSANRWELAGWMREQLAAGVDVVLDRYVASGVCFSAAKGLDAAWCRAPDVGLPAPDITFFLDLDPAKAGERAGYGGERYEIGEFQTKVRGLFLETLAEMLPNVVVVDAGRDIETIAAELAAAVDALAVPAAVGVFE